MRQFPTAFEFNEAFLAEVATAIFSCEFGTFLFDKPAERVEHRVAEKTCSLWSYVEAYRERFSSPLYLRCDIPLVPSSTIKSLELWRPYYFMYAQPAPG